MDGLVEQVGSQVVDCAAAGDNFGFPGCGGGLFGTVAVEVGFEFHHASEGALGVEFGEGDEVGVEATIYIRSIGWDGSNWGLG